MNFRIATMWAYVAVDPVDGDEGLCAVNVAGTWIPLCAADVKRLEALRPHVVQLARDSHREIRLIKLVNRIDVETIGRPS